MIRIQDVVNVNIKGLWGNNFVEVPQGIAVIKTNNLSYEGTIDYSSVCYRDIDIQKAEKNYLKFDDILAEKSGGTKTHSVGYVAYFDGESNKFVCNNFILVLRPIQSKIRGKYLFYQMRYMYENGIFSDCYNRTTGIQNLQLKDYLGKSIKLPTLTEQDSVIKSLNNIQAAIANKRKELIVLDELVKSQFILQGVA